MHEMGLTDAILKMVDRIASKEGVTTVTKITVEVGDLSGVVPRFLTDCWEAVAADTPYSETILDIQTVRGTLRCEDCKTEFTANIEDFICPACRSRKLTPLTGKDMTILEIESC